MAEFTAVVCFWVGFICEDLGKSFVGPATEDVGIFGPITVGTTGRWIFTAVGTKRVVSFVTFRIWGPAVIVVSTLDGGASVLCLTT